MVSYIAVFLSLICVILLSVILIRFKKVISTDKLIDKTYQQVNKLIANIQQEAKKDIDLMNEASKRIRQQVNDADSVMAEFAQATERLRNMISETEKLRQSTKRGQKITYEHKILEGVKPAKVSGRKSGNSSKARNVASDSIDENAAFIINKLNNLQPDLDFDQNENQILNDVTNVTSDGAAYKKIPLVISKVVDDIPAENEATGEENQEEAISQLLYQDMDFEKPQKSLVEKIKYYFQQGYNEEDIASTLSCSITEVQLVIATL